MPEEEDEAVEPTEAVRRDFPPIEAVYYHVA